MLQLTLVHKFLLHASCYKVIYTYQSGRVACLNHVLSFHYRIERAMLLNGMYVYEEYRNQGYGAELVKTALEHGQQIGIKLVSSDLSSYFTQKMLVQLVRVSNHFLKAILGQPAYISANERKNEEYS